MAWMTPDRPRLAWYPREGKMKNKKSEPLGQSGDSAFKAEKDALELRKISGSTFQQKLCNPVRLYEEGFKNPSVCLGGLRARAKFPADGLMIL